MTRTSLSQAQARRVALAAQGFGDRRGDKVDLRAFNRVLDKVALLQIDSVNVVTRAHYMPLFSRLGPYDIDLLHRASGKSPRRVFEYWGHEASFVRSDLQPALRWRMAAATGAWGGVRRLAKERPDFIDKVLRDVADRGPLTARQMETDVARTKDHWGWNWSEVKVALEWLFYTGQVSAVRRNTAFERVYDLSERVLPKTVVETATPTDDEAFRGLIRASAKAHGVGTEPCLRDYFRLPPDASRRAVAELVDSGELLPVAVVGWRRPAYLWHEAKVPRRVDAQALLSPFDSLIFERTRTEDLFGYRFRIEIYVPAPKRVYGYYVYSFLMDEQIVARVDLKADRTAGLLRVQGAYAEPCATDDTAPRLRSELESMAAWLGLDGVAVEGRGDLATVLGRPARSA
ncbi:MAG: winged helix-turn-helix domain-containing protein [Propionibacteriales bacterium]|nr:winged helix-turn-helix domain-containing protein [Propionibacteriales bacterium]